MRCSRLAVIALSLAAPLFLGSWSCRGSSSSAGGSTTAPAGNGCTSGISCAPANPCHTGVTACSGATATCTDTGTTLANGTPCGSASTCQSGSCTAAASGCGTAGAPTGDQTLTLQVAGVTRTYQLLVPASTSASQARALVFAFHGAGGSSASSEAYDLQGSDGASDQAIFVFPQGIDFSEGGTDYGVGWNEHCDGYDMAFFEAMVEHLAAVYCIDRTRIFAAGFSWGGDFSVNLGCCLGTKLRAVASASGADVDYNPSCPAPLPALHESYSVPDVYPSSAFQQTVATYRAAQGCSTQTVALPRSCVSYQGCTAPVVACTHPGLGHVIPPGWAGDVWSFFAALK